MNSPYNLNLNFMIIVVVRSFKGHAHAYFHLAYSKYHISDILRILRPTLQFMYSQQYSFISGNILFWIFGTVS